MVSKIYSLLGYPTHSVRRYSLSDIDSTYRICVLKFTKDEIYIKNNICNQDTTHYETHIDSYHSRITLCGTLPILFICAGVPKGMLCNKLSTKFTTMNEGQTLVCVQKKLLTFVAVLQSMFNACKGASAKLVFSALWLPSCRFDILS